MFTMAINLAKTNKTYDFEYKSPKKTHIILTINQQMRGIKKLSKVFSDKVFFFTKQSGIANYTHRLSTRMQKLCLEKLLVCSYAFVQFLFLLNKLTSIAKHCFNLISYAYICKQDTAYRRSFVNITYYHLVNDT